MATHEQVVKFKMLTFEQSCPFFEEEEIRNLIDNSDSFDEAVYKAFLAKAESGNFEIQGLSVDETYNMFLRLANEYRPNNSRFLRM